MPLIHLAGATWAAGGLVSGLWCVRQMILDRQRDQADRERRELIKYVLDRDGGTDVLDAYARMLAANEPAARWPKGRRR